MTDLDGGSSWLPDFAWIPEQKRLAKLLMSAAKKQAIAQGRSLRFLVYPWGITWINGSHETVGRWEAGISAGDQSLAWDEIEHKVGVSQIPNYFVFDVLVRAILAQRQPAR